MLLVFLPENALTHIENALPELEAKLRIRKGYRFRAFAGYQDKALEVFKVSVNQEQFSSCILSDAYFSKDSISCLLSGIKPKALEHTSLFIDAPDKGSYYAGNGYMHMLLRDKDLQHEYRVREGNSGFDFFLSGLPEIIAFSAKRFHK